LAAGVWSLEKAWPVVAGLISDPGGDKTLLLAAIYAAAGIGTPEAVNSLVRLLNSDDIVEAAEEALFMLEVGEFGDEFEEEDW
jgi:HEAT repeat protein